MAVKKDVLFNTPVLFLGFNRPDLTQIVFSEIRKIKPKKLYFAVDGPRKRIEDDIEKCQKTRDIISNVDWDCEVKTLFRQENLDCKAAVSSAIDWFFENEEEGIILEDDCLPNGSFFLFCQEMLKKYRNDERVMVIGGNSIQFGRKRGKYSYYFSRYLHVWGWASWRRTWKLYDVNMRLWPKIKNEKLLYKSFTEKETVLYWSRIFDDVFNGLIMTWEYQLYLMICVKNGLIVVPNVNLVSNIGFTPEASRTKEQKNILSNLKTKNLKFPLLHPPYPVNNVKADHFIERAICGIKPGIMRRIFPYLGRLLESLKLKVLRSIAKKKKF